MGADGGMRVIHRHRIGRYSFARVSPLTYVDGKPAVVLLWLHNGPVRLPGVCVPLDPAKLRRGATRRVFLYDGETSDPRAQPVRTG